MLEVLFEENDNDGGGGGMNDGCNIYKMPDQITVMLSFFTYTCKCKHFHTVGDTWEQLKSDQITITTVYIETL